MRKIILLLSIILILLLLPLFLSTYPIILLTEILIMGLLATSFNLLFGYTGLLSFGHAAFFGIGGYAAAFIATNLVSSLSVAMGIGILFSALAAMIIGFFCVRRDEIYFAILTLGFGMMLYTLVHQWRSITGGSDGITGFGIPDISFPGINISLGSPTNYYYFTLIIVVISTYLLWRLTVSPFGLILKAIRENHTRLQFSGLNVRLYRLIAFTLAGTFAGLAGVLFIFFDRMASPSMLHWTMSAQPVLMSILGGSQVFLGPFLGAFIFFLLEHIITKFTDSWMIFLGAILIPLVIFFPNGILGTITRFLKRQ